MAAGAFQLAAPKGTPPHKGLGYFWVGAMAIAAATSFWIHEFRWFGPLSILHVLSILVLATWVYFFSAIRQGRVAAHRNSMIQPYALALLLSKVFTLVPGRTMHAVFFSG